jgi:hypothetical protein
VVIIPVSSVKKKINLITECKTCRELAIIKASSYLPDPAMLITPTNAVKIASTPKSAGEYILESRSEAMNEMLWAITEPDISTSMSFSSGRFEKRSDRFIL